ncbi:hypothetical protein CEXT_299451 [Caerostris extrusa]|uniref:Uncharacterized protein n=1 Tax=Caerostris extrusa TaxID=172846 RepID=A0AAV4SDY7_CAEEX|nr:hypothetical protein CEXT_299451 [Caerostris extrusa]
MAFCCKTLEVETLTPCPRELDKAVLLLGGSDDETKVCKGELISVRETACNGCCMRGLGLLDCGDETLPRAGSSIRLKRKEFF